MDGFDPTDSGGVGERTEPSAKTGELFAGRYAILQTLGKGGMGVVYLVEDTLLGEQMALKVLHTGMEHDQKNTKRFLREILLTRKISHPNIVRTYEAGQTPKGKLYFTMEYVGGVSLKEHLQHEERLDTMEAVDLLRQIFAGIAVIHSHHVVHRDLKPGNVLLSKEGIAKIADFGVARVDSSDLTDYDEVVGSSAYMAPESWSGKDIAPPSDIYACGVLGYQLLTGRLPFQAKAPAEMMWQHLQEYPPAPHLVNPAVPTWLSSFVMLLLEKDAFKRPCDARELQHYLDNAVQSGFAPQVAPSGGFDMVAWNEEEARIDSEVVDAGGRDDILAQYGSPSHSQPITGNGHERVETAGVGGMSNEQTHAPEWHPPSENLSTGVHPPASAMLASEPPAWQIEEPVEVRAATVAKKAVRSTVLEVLFFWAVLAVAFWLFLFPFSEQISELLAQVPQNQDLESVAIVALAVLIFHSFGCAVPNLAAHIPGHSPIAAFGAWCRQAVVCAVTGVVIFGVFAGGIVLDLQNRALSLDRVGWEQLAETSQRFLVQTALLIPSSVDHQVSMKNGVVQVLRTQDGWLSIHLFLVVLCMLYAYLLMERLLIPAFVRHLPLQQVSRFLAAGAVLAIVIAIEGVGALWVPELLGGPVLYTFPLQLGVYGITLSGYQFLCALFNWLLVTGFCAVQLYRFWSLSEESVSIRR